MRVLACVRACWRLGAGAGAVRRRVVRGRVSRRDGERSRVAVRQTEVAQRAATHDEVCLALARHERSETDVYQTHGRTVQTKKEQ